MRGKFSAGALRLVLAVLALFCISGLAPDASAQEGERVKTIEFVGNRRFDSDVLRLSSRTKVGQTLDRTLLQEDVNTLYGFFDSVQLEEERTAIGTHLRFLVTENPVVRTVRLVGVEELSE